MSCHRWHLYRGCQKDSLSNTDHPRTEGSSSCARAPGLSSCHHSWISVSCWRLQALLIVVDCFFPLLSRLTALTCDSTWVNSFFLVHFFEYPLKWCAYSAGMAGATWNCCHLSAFCVHHAPCHFIQSSICKVHAYLAVTCHLHFWQNARDLLRATAVTREWNKSSGLFQKPQWGYMKEHQWKNIWYDTAVNIKYKCIQQKETNGNKNKTKKSYAFPRQNKKQRETTDH